MNNESAFPKGMKEMTLRDYFAAKAMQGLLSNPEMINQYYAKANNSGSWDINTRTSNIAELSYQLADAMLKERTGWV